MSGASVRIVSLYPWECETVGEWEVHWAGRLKPALLVRDALGQPTPTPALLGSYLRRVAGHYAFLAESDTHVVAACDRVRSYPIFFSSDSSVRFSNCARELQRVDGLEVPDPVSLLEGLMAGYVTGRHTLLKGLSQVRPGEVLVLEKGSGDVQSIRYYEYLPAESRESDEQLLDRLAAATEETFRRAGGDAAGRLIVVPLSGGLDSRLVVAMLKAQGYPNVWTFSYGPAHNEEAQRARTVAERLDIPWEFIPSTRKSARVLFQGASRRRYWRQADGLSSAPNMQEYQVFEEIRGRGSLPSDALVMNGQSGDFITGGHIPVELAELEENDDAVFDAIVAKHFSLWTMMRSSQNLRLIRERIEAVVSEAKRRGFHRPAHLYEYWEWQERQSKFVVNQQRTYDYFELDWSLPLWDREYCQFWREVPIRLKLRQSLYRKYLERWDYRGLFTDPNLNRPMIGWPGASRVVPPLARLIGLVAGSGAKEFIYRRLKYFGYYQHQLGSYPFGHFLERAPYFRNAVSLFSETWLEELFPEWMEENFPLPTHVGDLRQP